MAGTYTYDIPVVYTAQNNDSYINKRTIKIKECLSYVSNDIENTWNYNLCEQDDYYCQPWIKGDKIYAQFIVPNSDVKGVFPSLVNSDNDQEFWLPDAAITIQAAGDAEGNNYENVVIDTNYIPTNVCCFYIKWNEYLQDVVYEDFSACVVAYQGEGMTLLEAINTCLREMVDPENITSQVTEPYCEEKCGKSTLLIQGEYPGRDCDGNYAGLWPGDTANIYIPQFRIYGELVNDGFSFTETIQNNSKKSSKQVANYLFRTPKIPPYVARQIAKCFNSKKLTIDGEVYTKATALEKNNDNGNMWLINSILTKECDEINFTCA